MKKVLLIIGVFFLISCSIPPDKGFDSEWQGKYNRIDSFAFNGYAVDVIKYEGHKYMILQNGRNYGGAVSIIHLESCGCLASQSK